MEKRAQPLTAGAVDAERLQRAGEVVIGTRDEIRLQLRVQVEVGAPEPVHSDHPSIVVAIEHHQARNRGHANDQPARRAPGRSLRQTGWPGTYSRDRAIPCKSANGWREGSSVRWQESAACPQRRGRVQRAAFRWTSIRLLVAR